MRKDIFRVVKAVLASVLFSLVFVLVFTVIIHLFSLPVSVVKPVNQVFKIISIAAGGLIFIRGEKGLLKGAVYGVISVVLTFLLYGLISLSLSFSWLFLVEIAIGAAAGAICGVIAVNIKKNA